DGWTAEPSGSWILPGGRPAGPSPHLGAPRGALGAGQPLGPPKMDRARGRPGWGRSDGGRRSHRLGLGAPPPPPGGGPTGAAPAGSGPRGGNRRQPGAVGPEATRGFGPARPGPGRARSALAGGPGVRPDPGHPPRHILESLDDGVIAQAQQGRVQLFNSAAERLFDLPRSEVLGRPLVEAIREYGLAEALEAAAVQGAGQTRSVRLMRPVERELQIRSAPLRRADGELAGAVAVLRD